MNHYGVCRYMLGLHYLCNGRIITETDVKNLHGDGTGCGIGSLSTKISVK